MRARDVVSAVAGLLILVGSNQTKLSQASFALNGVLLDGFPNASERRVLVLTNRAGADPQRALSRCKGCSAGSNCRADAPCYPSAVAPLGWSAAFNRSARFHATNLLRAHTAKATCGLQHDSPCSLVSNINALYPPNGACNADDVPTVAVRAQCKTTPGGPRRARMLNDGGMGIEGARGADADLAPAFVIARGSHLAFR